MKHNFKRFLSLVLAMVMVFSMFTGNIAYATEENPTNDDSQVTEVEPTGEGTEPVHEHNYEVVTTEDATCMVDGVITYACGCTEPITAQGHNSVDGVCTVCGEAEVALIDEGEEDHVAADMDFTNAVADESGEGWTWTNASKTLALNYASITQAIVLPDASVISVAEGTSNSIIVTGAHAVTVTGNVTIKGNGVLTLKADEGENGYYPIYGASAIVVENTDLTVRGFMGLYAPSITISNSVLDIYAYNRGIFAYTETADSPVSVSLTNCSGTIEGGMSNGIDAWCKVSGDTTVTLNNCDNLSVKGDLDNTKTSGDFNRSGIRLYTKGHTSDAKLSIIDCDNLFLTGSNTGAALDCHSDNSENAENNGEATLQIQNSSVTATTTTNCWAAFFVNNNSVGSDAKSTITIENSSVKALAPKDVAIMTSTKSAASVVNVSNSTVELAGVYAGIRAKTIGSDAADVTVTGSTVIVTDSIGANYKVIDEMDNSTSSDGTSGVTDSTVIVPIDCVITANSDGTWSVPAGGKFLINGVEKVYPASVTIDKNGAVGGDFFEADVNGEKYETLKAAVNAANVAEGGATITLLDNVTLSEKLTITGDVTISGEYTITRDDAYTGTLFTVNAGATLTLDGGLTIDGGNEWTYKNDKIAPTHLKYGGDTYLSTHVAPEAGAPVATDDMFDNYGTLVVNQATVQNSYANSAVSVFYNQANASIILNDAVIKRNVSCEDAVIVAVDTANGSLTIKGNTVITENMGASNGGIIHVYGNGSTFSMEGGRIEGNYVVTSNSNNSSGTVICSYSGSAANKNTVKISGGVITNNHAEGYGTLYIHSNTVFEMSGGEVSNNTSYYPCYMRSSGNETTITGGKIVNNWVAANSYKNYTDIYSTSPIAISGGTFTQDVSGYLAPDTGLIKDEATGNYTTTTDIAEVNGTLYKSIAAAVEKANEGDTIKVLVNHKVAATTTIDKNIVLDLNGKTITAATAADPVFRIEANVTVIGEGKIDCRNGVSYAFILGKTDGTEGNLTINNGTFMAETTVASVTNGTLTVNGGNFAVNPYVVEGQEGNYNFLLNCIDANYKIGTAKIVVNGGVFHMYDPSNNAAEGAGTNFCADGYIAEELEENYWTVHKANYVADVNGVKYETLADAWAAAQDDDTIKLLDSIALDAMIVNTKKVTLDLDGKTITGTDNTSKNFSLIDNRGELTITGNGTMTVTATVNSGWNRYSAVIANNPGGKLIVENGTIEHLGGTDMAYGIDNLTNGKGTYAETVINGGTIKSPYRGIRQFLNGVEAQNILTINGGTIEGENKAIFFHDPSKNANSGTLTVGENAALVGDVYLFVTAGSTEWPVTVSIAEAAIQEGNTVLSANVPEGYEIQTVNGTIGVVKAMVEMDGVYYATIKDALWTLSSADTTVHTVKVLQDLDIDVNYSTYNYPILVNGFSVILDLNGKTITADWSKYTGTRKDNALIGLANGGKLTIIGDGTIRNLSDGKDDVENRIFWLSNAHATKQEILTIENGTFIQEDDIHLLYVEGVPSNVEKAGYFTYINGGNFQMVGYNDFFNSYDGRKHETVISGGTFNFDPTDGELKIADGFKAEEIADGTWGIVEMKVAQIGTKTYGTLAAAVEAAQPGQTIKLLKNASGAGVVIDKKLVIDFGGFTYTLTQPVGSTGTESNGFQILAGNTVTIRNGKLEVAASAADKFYILVQNYSDLNLNNMILDGTNLDKYSGTDGDSYTLSNNSGYVALAGTTIIANDEGDKAFAFDACDKTAWGYELPTVVVNSTSKIQGNIEAVAQIGTKYYATLQQAVDVAAAGAKIMLVRDSAGAGVVIDKDITILFGAHTYTLTEGVGSTGTESNGFQILEGNAVTLQNGTLKVADSAADKFYILVQNYADLTVNNMMLDGTNLDKWSKTDGDSYTLSNNSGNISIGGTTNIIANNDGDKAFAFDVCKFANYEEPVVSVATTAKITGAVEAAAKVGNKYYATLQAAIDAAANGKVVTVMKDIDLAKEETVTLDGKYNTYFLVDGKTVTIDLNGKKISGDYNGENMLVGVFSTDNGGNLTLTGNGTVDVTANSTVYGLVVNYESGCYTTIENGTFILDKASDSLIYTGGDEGVTVKGGTFTLGNVGTGENGSPWIFNAKGQNTANVTVTGGTFNANVALQYYAHEVDIEDGKGNLSYIIDNKDGTWTVSGKPAEVAVMTDVVGNYDLALGYATFKDAVASIAKGAPETTIVLQKDITVKGQFIGHSYAQDVIIDLNGFKMSSTDKALTVYRSGTEVTIKNGTVHGNTTGGTIQVTYGGKLTLGENTTITCGGSANALKVDANSTLIIADDTVKVQGGKADIVAAEGSKIQISAGYFKHPVDAAWCAEGYIPTEKLANGFYSVMKDPAYGMAANIGDNYYESLAAAIEEAKTGDTVTLLTDIEVNEDDLVDLDGNHTFFKVEGKTITIDLNEKTISADASAVTDKYVVGVFSTTNGGKLTLTGNGTVQGYSGESQKAAYLDPAKGNTDYNYKFYTLLVAYDEESLITVQNGTYSLDYSGDSLIYTSCNEGVVVNGGTFTLGNLGGIRNGMPWIFNARGQNQRHVIVNGGSFCADIQHQYYPFEVQMPKQLALSKSDDGIYTVVPAVAYVTEREWSSAWYTNEVGYATLEEAIAACEGPKTKVVGKKQYTSEQEVVVLLDDIVLEGKLDLPENAVLDWNGHTITQNNGAETNNKVVPVTDAESLIEAIKNGNSAVLTQSFETPANDEFLIEASKEIEFNGNGNIITTNGTGTEPGESYDYGYVGFIPANGEDAVVSNVKVVGSGFVEVGHYGVSTGGNYSITNLIIDKLNATLAVNNGGNNIAAAFSHYGNATMTNCVMTATTTAKDGYKPYDAAFVNRTKTTIIGGEFGNVYVANQAHVTIINAEIDVIDSCAITAKNLGMLTIGADAKIGTINLTPGTKYLPAIEIQEGAEVGAIVYNGVTYTVAEWNAR